MKSDIVQVLKLLAALVAGGLAGTQVGGLSEPLPCPPCPAQEAPVPPPVGAPPVPVSADPLPIEVVPA